MKLRTLNLILSLLALLVAMPVQSATPPKREHRSAWVTTAWRMCWPTTAGAGATAAAAQQKEADAILDIMQENGFNAVYFQVRGMSDAMYKSSYEPWSSYITGTRGTAPTYDPLEYWVEACHKRGMECFAWVNPYRYESSVSGASWTGSNDYRTTHPEWILEYNNASILNPGLQAVQTRIVDVCREIVSNYDIDGLVFDDYFYLNSIPNSYDADTYNSSGTSLSQADWRRDNVNTMVSKVYNMIQSVKPYVKFGISPAGVSKTSASKYGISTSSISSASDWQYSQIYSDPLAWLAAGTVDFISPQLYWITTHSTNAYGPLSKWWSDACSKVFQRHFYSSHSISFLYGANTTANWAEVAKQIQYNRDYDGLDAPGCVLFGSRDFSGVRTEGIAPYLKANKFQYKALPPTLTWKSSLASNPGKVTNLAITGTNLTWTGHNNMRYVVYAVPNGTSVSDDISSQYIIGNPYDTYFDVASYLNGYQLGVSVLDRYGYEYEVAWLGSDDSGEDPEPETGTLAQVTINSPADGSTVSGNFNFAWTALPESGVTYTIEVSATSSFSTYYSKETTSTTYASSNFNILTEGTTYYWRVKASKSGYTDSPYSWVGSFIIASSSTGGDSGSSNLTTDPATYSTVSGMTIKSKWFYSASTNNFPSQLTIANRGMTAYNGNVYIAQQGGALLELNGETGELLRTITLTGDCLTSSSGTSLSYAANDVFVDGAGNLCVSNLLNSTTQPFTVCTVNTSTGATTRILETYLNTTSIERIDYAAAYGNVTASGGQIWAAVASSDLVYRWTRNSSGSWTKESTTIGTYYPTGSASNNSVAPRIMPISTTQFILDGHNSAPALFTFRASSNATYNDGFANNTPLAPTANNWNGVCAANLGGTPIFIYVNAIAPNSFNVVTNPSNYNFSAMQKLWTIPANGFGSEANSCVSSQPVAVNNSDGSVTLYIYTPMNGLACYLLENTNKITDLESVSLTSPTGGITVSKGFDFYWSSLSGATYTLEVSSSSSFSTIDFTATTTSSSYSSSNFNLATGTTYYWRVKASKTGYNSSTSATGSFVTEVPSVEKVQLLTPADGETVSADGFTFSWTAVEGDGVTYTLGLTTLPSFETIMHKFEGLTTNSLSSNGIELLEGTTYYWHVHASKDGHIESISSTGSFVTPVVTPEEEEPETPVEPTVGADGFSYEDKEGLHIECLWIQSRMMGNYPETILGRDQRGMAAHNGKVYISERVGGANGTGQLLEFDGATGEYLRAIPLSGDYSTLSNGTALGYACNDVFTDGAGNLCVSNMVLKFNTSSQLTICTVDVSTGNTTRVFQTSLSGSWSPWGNSDLQMRVDNCSVYGDITKAGAKVYAASSSGSSNSSYKKYVYCWVKGSNGTWSVEHKKTGYNFYPSNAGYFGLAPRVMPIDGSRFIVDGSYVYPTLYSFSDYSAVIQDSFANNSEACPTGYANAGMCAASILGKPLFIYSFNDNSTEFFNFAITYNPNDYDFADMEVLWKIPANGLGNISHDYVSAIPATMTNADGSLTLFVYVPANGLAAYRISDASLTGVEEVEATEASVKMEGRIARISSNADMIHVYSTAGMLVATAANSNAIDLSALSEGIYIIKAQSESMEIKEKIVLE